MVLGQVGMRVLGSLGLAVGHFFVSFGGLLIWQFLEGLLNQCLSILLSLCLLRALVVVLLERASEVSMLLVIQIGVRVAIHKLVEESNTVDLLTPTLD